MNKFKELLDELRRRAAQDQQIKEALEELGTSEIDLNSGKGKRPVRLPYSSDPKQIEEPWA